MALIWVFIQRNKVDFRVLVKKLQVGILEHLVYQDNIKRNTLIGMIFAQSGPRKKTSFISGGSVSG